MTPPGPAASAIPARLLVGQQTLQATIRAPAPPIRAPAARNLTQQASRRPATRPVIRSHSSSGTRPLDSATFIEVDPVGGVERHPLFFWRVTTSGESLRWSGAACCWYLRRSFQS